MDRAIDRLVTSRLWGVPLMLGMLTAVFLATVSPGASVPSGMLAAVLIDWAHPLLKGAASAMPWWVAGLLVDGMYLATAWVVAVMLPPMAIFFPMFTRSRRSTGYLPRVAFNLDRVPPRRRTARRSRWRWAGAATPQVSWPRASSKARASGSSAIITNNFAAAAAAGPQILVATIFVGSVAAGTWPASSRRSPSSPWRCSASLTFATSW